MATFLVISGCLTLIAALAAIATAKNTAASRPEDEARLLALEFRGVVVESKRVAHTFDAGTSGRVKIKCDDGTNVILDSWRINESKYPVGMRVVKRAGQSLPEPTTEGPDPSA